MKGDFTKAKQIKPDTKEAVWKRQRGRSLLSGHPITVEMCCCHYIGKGEKSGVGYEWNIVGLLPEEHSELDLNKPIKVNGRIRYTNEEAQAIIGNHLNRSYKGWTREKCSYHKYFEEKDYGVTRNESNWGR